MFGPDCSPTFCGRLMNVIRGSSNDATTSAGVVGAVVADDDQFPVGERRASHALDRVGEHAAAVVRRENDRDDRGCGHSRRITARRTGKHDPPHSIQSPVVKRVAVLGAGIMGSATALFLARRRRSGHPLRRGGPAVCRRQSLERGQDPPRLPVRRRSVARYRTTSAAGGLAFKALDRGAHRVPDRSGHRAQRRHLRGAPGVGDVGGGRGALLRRRGGARDGPRTMPIGYLVPVDRARPRRLTSSELEADYDTGRIVAGFRVPERSVSTRWVADRFVDALAAEPGIEQRMRTCVRGVRRSTDALDSPVVRGDGCGHRRAVRLSWSTPCGRAGSPSMRASASRCRPPGPIASACPLSFVRRVTWMCPAP